jgi:hypothetical protein
MSAAILFDRDRVEHLDRRSDDGVGNPSLFWVVVARGLAKRWDWI